MTGIASMTHSELTSLIREHLARPDPELTGPLYAQARRLRQERYGSDVYLRGLIEFTSFCRQDCYYCGLRRGNGKAVRYRLSREEILGCCRLGHDLGLRTFVLQGGEDPGFDREAICSMVDAIKTQYPDSAVTLSIGEQPRESYQAYFDAGADRFLLRHETATAAHFAMLHPPPQTLESRKRCLYTLREIGFQTGAGLMVGSPGQTPEHLAADLLFLGELQPHMVGIGPFLPHGDTPFAGEPAGSLSATLLMLALTRLLLPDVLLPATTALGSLHPGGRELGFQAGANVVMPNLSPADVRGAYNLYDGKLSSGAEAAEGLQLLCTHIREAGFTPSFSRGDHKTRQ